MSDKHYPGRGTVVAYDDAPAFLKTLGENPVTLWYLGEQAERFMALADLQSTSVSIGDMGTRLDDYADDVEAALISLDQQILVPGADRLAWDVSIVAERYSTFNDLLLNIARFMHVEACMQGGGTHLFLIDAPRFGDVLAHAARANGLSVDWKGTGTSGPSIASIVRARLSALKTAWQRRAELKALRKATPVDWQSLKECDVLLVDWAETGMFSPGESITKTRNMYRIPEVLEQGGQKVGYLFLPVAWTQPFQGIAETVCSVASPTVFVDECRTMGDVFRGIWASLRLKKQMSGRFLHKGLDISAFVSLVHEIDTRASQASLSYSYEAVARTLSAKGIVPKAVYRPYENQGWERALDAGFRKWLPETKVVACQTSPFASRFITFFPSLSDIQAGRIPDKLICMGTHFAELFTKHGFPSERVSVSGALAFEDAFAQTRNQPNEKHMSDIKTVLCSTPIKYSEALNLCEKVVTAAGLIGGIDVIVNYHPSVDATFKNDIKQTLQARHPNMSGHIVYSNERGRKLLGQSDALFYNTSGTVFDALILGLPAYYVAVDGKISQNKVPAALGPELMTHDQVCEVLNSLKTARSAKLAEAHDEEFQRCLSSVDDQVFRDALNA